MEGLICWFGLIDLVDLIWFGLICTKLEWIKLVCSCPPVKRLSAKLFSSVVIYCAVLLLWHLPKNLIHAQNYLAKIDGANRCWQLLTGRFWKPQHARKVHNSYTFPPVWGHMTVEKNIFIHHFRSGQQKITSLHATVCIRPFSVIPRFDWNWSLRLHSVQFWRWQNWP